MKHYSHLSALFIVKASLSYAVMLLSLNSATAQSLTPEFVTAGYTLTDLGSIDGLPTQYGGLTIRPEQPDILYIGGSANYGSGALYTVPLIRDPETFNITGFGGAAEAYTLTPNIDGGVYFAPNGTLLFTRYSMNEIGQILPDQTYTSTPLNPLGVSSSVGSLAFVPSGYPGAGNLIVSSYSASVLYQIPFTIGGSGLYSFSGQSAEVSVAETSSGPEGIAYIPSGSLAFPNPSMAISSYDLGKVVVFEVGNHGLPVNETAREMLTGLTGAEGALIDPVTGDFLFSTFGGGNKVVRISGFKAPNSANNRLLADNPLFRIYPNPCEGICTLELKSPLSPGIIEIHNVLGEQLSSLVLQKTPLQKIDLSNLPAGLYIVKVKNELGTGFSRIIRQ